jgi:hypothetical protein
MFVIGQSSSKHNFQQRPSVEDPEFQDLRRPIAYSQNFLLLFQTFFNMSENKFVANFTVTEAVAVQQLKDALPDILNQAFGNSEVYTLWGIPLDNTSEDERIKVVLVKFLRARYETKKVSFLFI